MEKKTLKCQHCHEMNFPMVEFCHHCGESLHTSPAQTEQTLVGKWLYHAVDGMFWLVDESVRWWEIGKLSIQLKSLRRQRSRLLEHFESLDKSGGETSLEQRQALVSITEDLSRLSSREEFLRTRCWSFAPELMFSLIFVLFVYGIFAFNPGGSTLPLTQRETGVFAGQVSRVKDIPLSGHSIISRALWHANKLFIGGDGGLSKIDMETGEASASTALPEDFFVRDLAADQNRLFIGGFSGIYTLENTVLKPFYQENQLPVKLINALALTDKKKLLIGTIGHGMLRGSEDSAVFVLGTQGRTVRDFGRLDSDLWIMHEDGILTGRNDSFETLNLQVLAGRHLRRMVTTERSVFIGSDQGVIAGYRNARNWVWTLLSAGKPGFVNDLLVSGEVLFIGSDEGLYRFYKGRMERLSSIPCQALAAGDSFLAAVNPDSVMVFYFSPYVSVKDGSRLPTVPEIGSHTPSTQIISMIPMPDLQIGRFPDFRALQKKKDTSTVSQVATSTADLKTNRTKELPAELQQPVFSDLRKLPDHYLLATRNRGIWFYDDSRWHQVKDIPQLGVDSLASNNNACYAYGNGKGVFKITASGSRIILASDETKGLLNLHVDKEGELLLLHADGTIKTVKDEQLRIVEKIPGEFKGEFHSIWKIAGKFVVVVNRGVLIQEADKQWNLVFFKGRIDGIRVTSATRGPDNNIFIGINDGRIFSFAENSLEYTGTINDQPLNMNYEGFLWVAGSESLYFLEEGNLIATPFHAKERILGAFPIADSKSIMVFTGSGIEVIAGRQ